MFPDSPVLDLDHADMTGVIRMAVGPETPTSALNAAVGLLPAGWHRCAFTDAELYGPETGVFRVSGHPITHDERCASWLAPLTMSTV